MSCPTTNLTITAIKAELGVANNNVGALNPHANVNVWSFYTPATLVITSGLLAKQVDASPFNMGEFRGYNHAAAAPSINAVPSPQSTNPSADLSLGILIFHQEANLKILTNQPVRMVVKLYSDSGRTSLVATGSTAIVFNANTPPTNYKGGVYHNLRPESSTLVMTTVPFASITHLARYYGRVTYADGGDVENGRLPFAGSGGASPAASEFDLILRIRQQPTLSVQGAAGWTPNPLYSTTGVAPTGTPYAKNVIMSNVAGNTSWNFSFEPDAQFLGGTPSTAQIAGDVQVAYEYPFSSGTFVNIGGVRSFGYGSTVSVTNAISGGLTQVDFDQAIVIRATWTSLTVNIPVV